ncbi:unnamed protein product [Cylindrotheca closterium]|uniref:Uncharacterized protein n=1 Tax=Cylindrotheca closterium TaxID=2856 RepID=A0AAD2FRC4_9STRA|nr:unnamed protein product [Cylindrotheca closterium]
MVTFNTTKRRHLVTTFVTTALVISTSTTRTFGLTPNSSSNRIPKNNDGLQYKDRESNYYDNNSYEVSEEKDANGMFLAEENYEWMFDEEAAAAAGDAPVDAEATVEAVMNSIAAEGDLLSPDWEEEVERAFQERYVETYSTDGTTYSDTMEMEEEMEEDAELHVDEDADDEIYYEDEFENDVISNVPSFEILKEWTEEYIELIDLAGGGMTRVSVGMQHTMHDAFVFTSPKVGPIGKLDFVNLMEYYNDNGLDLASAVPDLSVSYDGWHQDPDDPWRIWVFARYSGTHLGSVSIPNSGLKLAAPKRNEPPVTFTTGPQVESFLWTPDKQLLWQTMGYVGDAYTGSNKGFGGLDGLLVSLGLPYLYLEATNPVNKVANWFSQFRGDSAPKTVSSYSRLPQWWHERKAYDWNVQR